MENVNLSAPSNCTILLKEPEKTTEVTKKADDVKMVCVDFPRLAENIEFGEFTLFELVGGRCEMLGDENFVRDLVDAHLFPGLPRGVDRELVFRNLCAFLHQGGPLLAAGYFAASAIPGAVGDFVTKTGYQCMGVTRKSYRIEPFKNGGFRFASEAQINFLYVYRPGEFGPPDFDKLKPSEMIGTPNAKNLDPQGNAVTDDTVLRITLSGELRLATENDPAGIEPVIEKMQADLLDTDLKRAYSRRSAGPGFGARLQALLDAVLEKVKAIFESLLQPWKDKPAATAQERIQVAMQSSGQGMHGRCAAGATARQWVDAPSVAAGRDAPRP
jgi:hypothetical protein